MIKNDLREQGFSVIDKTPKQSRVNTLWGILALILIAGTILGVNLFFQLTMGANGDDLAELRQNSAGLHGSNPLTALIDLLSGLFGEFWSFLIIFIIFFILYFAFKLIMTILVCRDKLNSIKLKVLLDKGMPVCSCKEALRVWQVVLVYAVPFALMYSLLFASYIWTIGEPIFLFILVFMSFFLAFDLTAVVYVLIINARNDIDYISIDNHVYIMTLFKQTYVRSGDRPVRQHIIETPAYEPKIESFIEITSCANLDCDNYRHELDENAAVCPLCGKRTYKATAMADMTTCVNDRCENYGEELKDEAEICSLCGEKTGNLALRFDRSFAMPAIIISAISAAYFCVVSWFMSEAEGSVIFMFKLLGGIMLAVSIILGYRSKSKIAMIIAFMAVLISIGYNIFIENF